MFEHLALLPLWDWSYSFNLWMACYWLMIGGVGSFVFMPHIAFRWAIALGFGGISFGLAGFSGGVWVFSVIWVLTFIFSLCVWDIYERAVPDWQNLSLFVISIASVVFLLDVNNIDDVLKAAGLLGLCYVIGKMIWYREILGEADIVFCGSMAGFIGFFGVVVSIFWGCVLASLLAICGKILGRKIQKIPLIPFIVAGYAIGLLV